MKNKYEIRGDVTVIFLNSKKHGTKELLIDTEDFSLFSDIDATISVGLNHKVLYALFKSKNKPRKNIFIHRIVMDFPEGRIVDHINHNGLDNRKENLRVVTTLENTRNRKSADERNKVGIRGVHWMKQKKHWRVRFKVNKKFVSLGHYRDLEEAKKVAEIAETKIMDVDEFLAFAKDIKNRRNTLK